MAGFGLYETLRILAPGALAVGLMSAVLRLAGGTGDLWSEGPYAAVLTAMDGPVLVFLVLVAGFGLYLVDLPSRSRLFRKGDPKYGIQLPSAVLGELVNNARNPNLDRRSITSLYFILSDGHLPEELHKRVYYFGSLYRIYADARFLLAATVVVGAPLAMLHNNPGALPGALPHLSVAALAMAPIVGIGVVAAIQQRRGGRHAPGDPEDELRLADVSGVGAAVFVAQLGGLLSVLLDRSTTTLIVWTALCLVALMLWTLIELGPPDPEAEDSDWLRNGALRHLGARDRTGSQYRPGERTLLDVALFAPALAAAAFATAGQQRPAAAVLLWGGLALASTAIMSVRKHESRLINAFQHQQTWLRLNSKKIQASLKDGPGWS